MAMAEQIIIDTTFTRFSPAAADAAIFSDYAFAAMSYTHTMILRYTRLFGAAFRAVVFRLRAR